MFDLIPPTVYFQQLKATKLCLSLSIYIYDDILHSYVTATVLPELQAIPHRMHKQEFNGWFLSGYIILPKYFYGHPCNGLSYCTPIGEAHTTKFLIIRACHFHHMIPTRTKSLDHFSFSLTFFPAIGGAQRKQNSRELGSPVIEMI